MSPEFSYAISSLKHYAKFLRSKNPEDAVRALLHPKDMDKIEDINQEEHDRAVELCKRQTMGKVAFVRWRNSQKKIQQMSQDRKEEIQYYRNMAFTILTREGREIPQELLQAILSGMDEQIDDFESTHQVPDGFDKTEWLHSKLETALKRRTGTKAEVYRKFSSTWNEYVTWQQLRDRHKSWTKRRTKENKKWIKREEWLRSKE